MSIDTKVLDKETSSRYEYPLMKRKPPEPESKDVLSDLVSMLCGPFLALFLATSDTEPLKATVAPKGASI
jgi:hypothetical protein